MSERTCLVVVLAAGEGVRLRSRKPKVLHRIAGRSLLGHVLQAVLAAGATDVAVVVGPEHETVVAEARRLAPSAQVFTQTERRGTAHAVLAARKAVEKGVDDVLVVFGDTPSIRRETLVRLRKALAADAAVAVLGFRKADPSGYGRLITRDGELTAIREDKDASLEERAITLCNGGLMGLQGRTALRLLDQIGDANANREFYLSDAVEIARKHALRTVVLETDEEEVAGVNTKAQLAEAEAVMQRRLRRAALDNGVTMTAPETVFLSADTVLGRDVTIEPHVVFGPGVVVEDEAVIHSFSHLEGARVGRGASVGPFARLRPGTELGEKTKIGNFVETKATVMEAGAKANHLTYLGDAHVGAGANIGAGTITCNYDGVSKSKTEIGKGAFIGSNSALVAPVAIGDDAYVGSGSVINSNVPPGALAIARGVQVIKDGWVARFRALKQMQKKQ